MAALYFDGRQLDRSVWATLTVWVLALAAGLISACALTPAGPVARACLLDDSLARHEHAGAPPANAIGSLHERTAALDHLNQRQNTGRGLCLKFCAAGFRKSLERSGSQGPPLAIRFLRLTV